jgi:Ca2+-binding RTX toxin-like protein
MFSKFRLMRGGANFTVGKTNGAVTLAKANGLYTLTPETGNATSVTSSDVSSFIVNNITMSADTASITGEAVTGTGTISISDDAADDTNLTGIATSNIDFGSDNTIAVSSGKTLTLHADHAATATSGITGAGNVVVEDDSAAAGSSILITATGNVTVDAGTGNDTIDLGAAENVTADDTIDGGGGTDELQITADNGTTGAVLDDLVDIDTVTVEVSSTATDNAKVTLQYTASNTDALTIDATALTSADADFTLVATDTQVGGVLTVNGGAGDDTISTGAGNDIITGGTGKDIMTGGAGDDEYIFAGTADLGTDEEIVEAASGGTDKITISADTDFSTKLKASSLDEIDSLSVAATKTATFTGAQLTGETIALLGVTGSQDVVVSATSGGTTDLSGITAGSGWTSNGTDMVTINGVASANEIIIGTATNDTIDAKTGDDTVTGGAGADAIDVDAGTDQVIINAVVGTSSDSTQVVVSGNSNDTGQDVIEAMTFGSGADTIKIVATNVDSFVHATDTDIGTAGAEALATEASFTILTGLIDLNQTTDGSYADAGDIAVSVKSGTSNFTETNFEAALAYDLTSDANGSTLTGGGNADTLAGGAGVDIITGGDGADTLSGAGGSDVFVFDIDDSLSVASATAGGGTGADSINDFASGDLIKITGELADGFAHTTDVLVGVTSAGTANEVKDVNDFLATTYLVSRDGVITDDMDTAINVTSDGSTAAFADAAAAQTATVYDVTLASGATVVLGANNDKATGTTGTEDITGGAGNDILIGGDGADVLTGGADDDYLQADVSGNDDIDTIVGGAGDDTFVWSDAGEADKFVEASSGGTDTILFADALSLAGMAFGVAANSTNANAPIAQFEQLIIDTGTTATVGSAQVTGLSLKIGELADGTADLAIIIADGTDLDISNFGFTGAAWANSTGSTTAFNGLDGAADTITITGDGDNTIVGSSIKDTIDLVEGANTVTGGGGDDAITCGAGVDTITIAYGGEGTDKIFEFLTGGADVIDFTGSNDATNGGSAKTNTEVFVGNADDAIVTGLIVLDNNASSNAVTDADSLSIADIVDRLNDLGNDGNGDATDNILSFTAATDVAYGVISDGTDTALIRLNAAGNGDTVIDAADVAIVAIFDGVSDAGTILAAQFSDFS